MEYLQESKMVAAWVQIAVSRKIVQEVQCELAGRHGGIRPTALDQI
jgi:hypothetical protein